MPKGKHLSREIRNNIVYGYFQLHMSAEEIHDTYCQGALCSHVCTLDRIKVIIRGNTIRTLSC